MINKELVPASLKKLRLSAMNACWEDLSIQAVKENWSFFQYLGTLADLEIASRAAKRIERHLVEAKLPLNKTLDTFDFANLTSITGAQISSFAEDTQWVTQACNLLLFGPSGTGKTHLAAAIGRRLIEHGKRVFFTRTTALVQKLQLASLENKLSHELEKLEKFDLIILDDFSYVKKNEAETSVLFELIGDRYGSRSLLITSNQPFGAWDTIFPDSTMAVAAIDRLVHHASIVNINEPSYRTASRLSKEKPLNTKD
jgi:DNA replication protein DnaC